MNTLKIRRVHVDVCADRTYSVNWECIEIEMETNADRVNEK